MVTRIPRVALYARLSREDVRGKAEGGIESIGVQKADATRAVEAQSWRLVQTHVDDGVSGTLIDRPGLAALRATAARREIDVVCVRDLDRLGRLEPLAMMQLVAELQGHGVRVWSYRSKSFVTLDGLESVVTYVQAIAGRQYVESIRKNVIDGLRRRAQEGRAVKAAAYGYRVETSDKGKHWVIEPKERDVVLKLARIFVETGLLNGTAIALNQASIPSPKGKPWRVSMVRTLLRRPLYRGYY